MNNVYEKTLESKSLNRDLFQNTLLAFRTLEYADMFVCDVFPEPYFTYAQKFDVLNEYFEFDMVGCYNPEELTEKDKDKANYLFTLQHLLNKVQIVGVNNVIKE